MVKVKTPYKDLQKVIIGVFNYKGIWVVIWVVTLVEDFKISILKSG